MNVNAGPDTFELQLALVNAYGEVGNVDKCHAHLKDMLTANPNIAALVTWGYNALLKAYRCALPSQRASWSSIAMSSMIRCYHHSRACISTIHDASSSCQWQIVGRAPELAAPMLCICT